MKNDVVKGGELIRNSKTKIEFSERIGNPIMLTFGSKDFISIINILSKSSTLQGTTDLTIYFTRDLGIFLVLHKKFTPQMIMFQLKSKVN